MAETKSLSQFKSRLAGGGARPNLFEVSVPTFPSAIIDAWGSGDQSENGTFKFMCKAAQLPASTIAEVTVPFRGRNLKVAGDRTFEPWTVTIINDEDFQLRTSFERWMNVLSKLDDATVLRTYKFYDIFPTEVSAIDLSYDTTNDYETFDVTFQVQYFTVGNSLESSGSSAGEALIE